MIGIDELLSPRLLEFPCLALSVRAPLFVSPFATHKRQGKKGRLGRNQKRPIRPHSDTDDHREPRASPRPNLPRRRHIDTVWPKTVSYTARASMADSAVSGGATAAAAAAASNYKKLKEDFVSNLSGGSAGEVFLVTAVAPVSPFLFFLSFSSCPRILSLFHAFSVFLFYFFLLWPLFVLLFFDIKPC